ncbi:MAG: type 1 glutamine amidotransferase domain-containing protein [Caldilineaceae bacterium]|nr:type 1 glutamine amidotransferase domain-containing protein [Caldilineaceae bacterium]
MSGTINLLNPDKPKRVLILASNPVTSPQTGWPIGFWWAELTHPYWEFVEHGYEVEIASPDGGPLQGDGFSDPRDSSGYSADDLISLGFIHSPTHSALIENSISLNAVDLDRYDAIFLVGGQGPMVTFYNDERVHRFVAQSYAAGKVVAVVCHATCVLLKTRLADGNLLVAGKTWTGFADSEEDFADSFVGFRIQPFRIEEEAKGLADTNFIVDGRFKSHAVRDGRLITGQQQYSGAAAARLVIEALGV